MTARSMGTKNKEEIIPDSTSLFWARKKTHIQRLGTQKFSGDTKGDQYSSLLSKLVQHMSLNLEKMNNQKGFQSPNLGFIDSTGKGAYDKEHKRNKQQICQV